MSDTPLIQNFIFGGVIALISIVIYRALRARHLAPSSVSLINFDDLLLDHETGKISKPAVVMFTALLVSSLVVAYQTFKGTLTDLTFGAYLTAWVLPTLTKIYKDSPVPQPAGPTTVVTGGKTEIKQ